MLVTHRGERVKCFQDPQLVEVLFATYTCEDKSKYNFTPKTKKFIICLVCFTFCTFLALVLSQATIVQKLTIFYSSYHHFSA